jgi:hypothetical protein
MVQPPASHFRLWRFDPVQRVADSGNTVTFQFCPVCGSTVYWEAQGFPGLIAVAVGSFADPAFPAPAHSVCEWRRHHWVKAAFDMPVEHSNDDDARPRGGLALGLDCV